MDSICRTCLRRPEKLLPLLEDAQLPYKIEMISAVNVLKNDNLPMNVCAECIVNINVSYNFRKLIINSDVELRNHYVSLNKINTNRKQFSIEDNSENSDSDSMESISANESKIKIECEREDLTYMVETATDDCTSTIENTCSAEAVDDNYTTETDNSVVTDVKKQDKKQVKQNSSEDFQDRQSIKWRRAPILYSISKAKVYKCRSCDYSHSEYSKFKKHKQIHCITKAICNICGKSIRSDNLRKHISIHTEPPIACKECGKMCKNTESLRGHALIHRGIELKCKICGKVYKYRAGYALHIKTHTQGNIKTAQCPLCSKLFRGKTDLKKHMRSHTGERPYPCEFCKKGFSSTHALKTHRRQHTNEKPYACTLCPMAFPQKVSLRTHMKSKHPTDNTDVH